MPGGAINITIGGNAQQLTQAAGQAANALNGLAPAGNAAAAGLTNAGNAATAAGRGLGSLAPATRPSLQGLTLLGNAATAAARGLGGVAPAANQANRAVNQLQSGLNRGSQTVLDFSRVVQDAPFAFNNFGAIANNIDPLFQSFTRLRAEAARLTAETGRTVSTMSLLGQSLTGAAGIGLGISIVTSLLTAFSTGLIKIGGASDEFKKAMKEANEEAGKEIANLRIAATIASDVTRSTDERKKAAKELQSQLKENNVTLSEEAILNGNVATAINLATKAILERAKARAIENRIAELTAQNLNRELERPEILRRQLETQKKLNEERAKAGRVPAGAPADVGIRPETVGFATDALNKLVALDQATLDASTEINKLLALVKDEDISPKFDSDKAKKDTDLLKQRIAALKELQGLTGLDRAQQVQLAQLEIQLANRDSIKAGFTADELQQQIDGILEKAFPVKTFEFKLDKIILEPQTVELGANIDIAGNVLQGGNIPEGFFNPVVDKMKEAAAAAQEKIKADLKASFEESIAQSVTQGIFGAADSLGAAIGDLLSGESVGNVLASAGEGLLKIMGSILQDIGKQIALFSGLVAKIRSVVANVFTNPAAGIGLGLALVAAGALLRSIKLRTSTPGFADGVTNFTGGQALVGERGPELVTLPAGSNVIPRDPFSVQIPAPSLFARGDDLYLSYNRTASRRRRI